MTWRSVAPFAAVALTLACEGRGVDPELVSADGRLEMVVSRTAHSALSATGRLVLLGPTDGSSRQTTFAVSSGTTDTIGNLDPGTYQLGLEYHGAGTEVQDYGETTVQVRAGSLTRAVLTLTAFRPGKPAVGGSPAAGDAVVLSVPAIAGASGYDWQWDEDTGFGSPQSSASVTPRANVVFSQGGTHYARVRARNQYDGHSSWGDPISIEVAPGNPPLEILTDTILPDGIVGEPYSETLLVQGGVGNYSWSVVSGSLPAGLALSSGGLISGTPDTATAGAVMRIEVTSGAAADTASFRLTVLPAAANLRILTNSTLPEGTVGRQYVATLEASGGVGQYQWAVVSGTLPAGLTLGATGNITGAPSEPTNGPVVFTVRVTSGSDQAERAFNLTIRPVIELGASTYSFSQPQGGIVDGTEIPANRSHQMVIANHGATRLDWVATGDQLWFGFIPAMDTIGPGGQGTTELRMQGRHSATLTTGSYQGIILVRDQSSGPDSAWATVNLTVGAGPPAIPSDLQIVGTPSVSGVTLSWTDNSDDEERFIVEFRSGSWQVVGQPQAVAGTGSTVMFTHQNPPTGVSLHYRVRACNTAFGRCTGQAPAPGAPNTSLIVGPFTLAPANVPGRIPPP